MNTMVIILGVGPCLEYFQKLIIGCDSHISQANAFTSPMDNLSDRADQDVKNRAQ